MNFSWHGCQFLNHNLDFVPVVLYALNNTATVLEPDSGENTTVVFCFSATISQPLDRSPLFLIQPSPLSTANIFEDVVPNGVLLIPQGFVGDYYECVTFTVYGDDEVEGDEVAIFYVLPVQQQDSVVFHLGGDAIVINITDSDGKGH